MTLPPVDPNDPFARFRGSKRGPKRGICIRCGKAENAGRVAVALHEKRVNPAKKPGDANMSSWPILMSTGVSMCAPCAVEVFEKALDLLEAETGPRLDRHTGEKPA